MQKKQAARVLGTGIAAGLLAFWLTGAFHWTYLTALGSMLLAFSHANRSNTPTESARSTSLDPAGHASVTRLDPSRKAHLRRA